MMTITRITRYGTDDPECNGDYYEVILKHGRKILGHFGDYYHDKGWEKADGFIAGMKVFEPNLRVVTKDVADYDV
jgi:hypothetical protein